MNANRASRAGTGFKPRTRNYPEPAGKLEEAKMQAHFYVVENKKGHKALILEGTNFGQGKVLAETQKADGWHNSAGLVLVVANP